jgi:hypothetical protein
MKHLPIHSRRQPIFIADQMIKHPTQPSSIVWKIANGHAMLVMKQDDDDTARGICKNICEDPGESPLSSDIDYDDLDN